MFITLLEENLQTEAQSQIRAPGLDRLAHGVVEPLLSQVRNRVREGTDTRQHHTVRTAHSGRITHHARLEIRTLECLRDAAKVARAVVHHCNDRSNGHRELQRSLHCRQADDARISFDRNAQRTRQSLEDRLDDVVRTLSVPKLDVEIEARILREGVQRSPR